MLAALGAFLGHLFPVWLKFKGGKGVATYIGVLIGLFWPAALVFCVIWLATAATTRYSSLSALVAAFVTPLFLWWFGHPALASLFVVLTLLLFYAHRENIKRLQAGPRAGSGRSEHRRQSGSAAIRSLEIRAALAHHPGLTTHYALQRFLHKPRRRQRPRIVAVSRDHLHADRQSAVGDVARER